MKIDKLRNTGDQLIATIEGQEVALTTFRQAMIDNGVVYLPPPFTDQCERLQILNDPHDDESDFLWVEGCIRDREVAQWMGQFLDGTLKKGTLR